MPRNADHTWPVPSWIRARDCEALHGRVVAEATCAEVLTKAARRLILQGNLEFRIKRCEIGSAIR